LIDEEHTTPQPSNVPKPSKKNSNPNPLKSSVKIQYQSTSILSYPEKPFLNPNPENPLSNQYPETP